MHRRLALLAVAALAGCQDYQYTPVGRCLLQPGTTSVGTVGATDLLFVIDDSHSMVPVQQSLASSLGTFINRLAQKQTDRASAGKEPFDVYISVTSTSVLVNRKFDANGLCGRKVAGTCSIDTVTRPPARDPYTYPCTGSDVCGDIVTHYYNYTNNYCTRGVLRANGDPYPAGNFLAAGSNPGLLPFTKDLDWAHAASDGTIQGLITMFKQNVQVGDCGANQEMPFEAARRTVIRGGGDWPHKNSKLALVFVGNEDDCSTKPANEGGLVWDGGQPGHDSCVSDPQHQLTAVGEYVSFFTGLGRPLSAAFVRPGMSDCSDGVPGTRMHALAAGLSGAGASVVEASICASSFATALESIADALPPPDRIRLPTTPAAGHVTRLVIQTDAGDPVHTCLGPDPGKEWWFIDCDATPSVPLAADRTAGCIELKAGGACQPQGGQKLVAEYLGRVPASGCSTGGDAGKQECANALGGTAAEWACEGATSLQKGTCVCTGTTR